MSNWELFQAAYQSASPEVKALIDSEKIPTCVEAALIKRDKPQLQVTATNQIAHQVLGTQTIDETIKNLTLAGIPDPLQFFAEVQGNLDSSSSLISSQPSSQNLASEIKAAEHDLASLQTVRTMTSDMRALGHADDVPVYRSLQEDILAPTPPTDTPATPRWESESTR